MLTLDTKIGDITVRNIVAVAAVVYVTPVAARLVRSTVQTVKLAVAKKRAAHIDRN